MYDKGQYTLESRKFTSVQIFEEREKKTLPYFNGYVRWLYMIRIVIALNRFEFTVDSRALKITRLMSFL